jgi:hypothetical protein
MQTLLTDGLDDGYLQLAGAVARQWLAELPHELPVVSRWLGIDEGRLLRGLGLATVPPAPPPPPPLPELYCQQCGAPVARRRGLPRQFCDDCRRQRANAASLAAKRRKRGTNGHRNDAS